MRPLSARFPCDEPIKIEHDNRYNAGSRDRPKPPVNFGTEILPEKIARVGEEGIPDERPGAGEGQKH